MGSGFRICFCYIRSRNAGYASECALDPVSLSEHCEAGILLTLHPRILTICLSLKRVDARIRFWHLQRSEELFVPFWSCLLLRCGATKLDGHLNERWILLRCPSTAKQESSS